MKSILLLQTLILFMMTPLTMQLFDFSLDSDLRNWYVVDDGVMGGRSAGNLKINEEGHGLFSGKVSLENNGGFSSIRYRFNQQSISDHKVCKIRLRGDGKRYQFRVKSDKYDRHSYIYHFETTGDWETIVIPMSEMYPAFRGRKLNMPNYPIQQMEELSFMIGNKRAEIFKLELDKIILE